MGLSPKENSATDQLLSSRAVSEKNLSEATATKLFSRRRSLLLATKNRCIHFLYKNSPQRRNFRLAGQA
jgi:hypothetical protein